MEKQEEGRGMNADCQIELKEDFKSALGLTCLSNVWHDAQRVSLGYILIEFGDFIGKMLVKQKRAVEDKEQEE